MALLRRSTWLSVSKVEQVAPWRDGLRHCIGRILDQHAYGAFL
jgi:hypothetical protein